jgi:hypothetical protein
MKLLWNPTRDESFVRTKISGFIIDKSTTPVTVKIKLTTGETPVFGTAANPEAAEAMIETAATGNDPTTNA